ncbi:hypothetical protein TeGR_g1708 [Tetraparma gracilis]|uniref:holo-[acyl-carrier-protein] synthase n=1 Tax=Tetraparma gracilis TaxID=2962635 RepID=A0ABQ6MN13_9STRA|nr:hypothetical protein TeGR_g1708 [Tetraparma gracilis]
MPSPPSPPKHPILRYHKHSDRLLHLCSHLLKLHLLPSAPLLTSLGKPYLPLSPLTFSLSHHNRTCALALLPGPGLLVGADVVDPAQRSNLDPSFAAFRGEAAAYFHFHLLWALKEAYFKALGLGLTAPPLSAEFTLLPAPTVEGYGATVKVGGEADAGWRFWFREARGGDVVCVAVAGRDRAGGTEFGDAIGGAGGVGGGGVEGVDVVVREEEYAAVLATLEMNSTR